MALTECPKCGGKISSTAESCPHCGYDFKEDKRREDISKDFARMSESSQRAVRAEYDAVYGSFSAAEAAFMKLSKTYNVILWITYASMACALVGIILGTTGVKIGLLLSLIFFAVFIAAFITTYVFYAKVKAADAKRLQELKKFVSWLKESKNLSYNVVLTEKERKIYNSL